MRVIIGHPATGSCGAMRAFRPGATRTRAVFFSGLVLVLAHGGCAMHADVVELRTEVQNLAKTQLQEQKRQEELQGRVKSLEGKIDVAMAAQPEQVQVLASRLKDLEDRLGRFVEAQRRSPGPPSGSVTPESLPSEPSRQSKPARLPPLQRPGPVMPGTPGITPTSAFNLAYNDYLNGQYDLALTEFQQFLKDFPSTSLTPQAHYWIGEAYYSKKDYVRAIEAFERVIRDYPQSEKVPPALFKLGLAAAELGDSKRARESLKRVIEKYSFSDEAKLAKNKLAEMR